MKRQCIVLFLFIISISYLVGCDSQAKLNNNTDEYPKYFEIVENNGEVLVVRIREMIPDCKSYNYRLSKNGDTEGDLKRVDITEENYVDIKTEITETGKYTFEIFINDAEYKLGASWRILTNAAKKALNKLFKNPVWVQDVFVVKQEPDGLSDSRIKELAGKYAPFLFIDKTERYLPASIEYLLNREDTDNNLNNLKLTLKFRDIDLNSNKKVTRRTRFTGVARKNINKIFYKDLDKVLPYNGDNISVLDTIGTNPIDLFNGKNLRESLEKRTDNNDFVTVYYSFFPNPNQEKREIVINYHFLYIYDSKKEAKGDMKKASHIFDRESISIVFDWDKSNPDLEPQPKYLIYGAHLPGQLITLKREDGGDEQKWKTRRVKVQWKDADKIKVSNTDEFHPIVAVAKGSHATYPVPGQYGVKPIDIIETVEPASLDKLLLPSFYSYDGKLEKVLNGGNNIISYELKDLELGSITSSSWNSILAYSGYIVDIIGLKNAKFPPFTERETDVANWVNGSVDDPVHNWDKDKVDQKTKDELGDLVIDIGKNLKRSA